MEKIISKGTFLIYGILFALVFYFGAEYHMSVAITAGLAIAVFLVVLIWTQKRWRYFELLLSSKKVLITIICIGCIARLTLLLFEYREVTSDESTYFNNAIAFSTGEELSRRYLATFPYLFSYIALLGSVMKILGTSIYVAIILNIVLDIIGAGAAFLFGLKMFEDYKMGRLLLYIWLLNPFQVVWCMRAMPIIVVNTVLMLCLCIWSCMGQKISLKRYIVLSVILSILIGIGNAFRPIFVILLIAIFLHYIYILIFQKNSRMKCSVYIMSFCILCLGFAACNKVYQFTVSSVVEYDVPDNAGGWSMYVGSNTETQGVWFADDNLTEMFNVPEDEFDPQGIHEFFKEKAIVNYKSYDFATIVELWKNKLAILTKNVYAYSWECFTWQTLNSPYIYNIFLKFWIWAFWFFIVVVSILAFWLLKSKYSLKGMFPIFLLEIGLIISHIFVEVSPRYFLPALVPLMINTGYLLYSILKRSESV